MDNELRDAFRRLADDARDYSDADRVITSARRRRIRREVLAGAAVLALLVGGGLGVRLVRDGGDRAPDTAPPSGSASQPASPSPSASPSATAPQISAPADLPLLPATPVGPAKLLYTTCPRTCPTIVLLTSGAQYRLPDAPPFQAGIGSLATATLSPDGTAVSYQGTDSYVVRRLTDATVWQVPGGNGPTTSISPAAWAPGSDALLLGRASGCTLLDLRTGTQRQIDPPAGYVAIALSAGKLPLVSREASKRLVLAELQRDGTLRTVVDADLTAQVAGGTMSGPGGGSPMVTNYNLSGGYAVAVFEVGRGTGASLRLDAAGRFVRRVDKPGGDGEWGYLGPYDGDLAFQHTPGGGGPVELVVVRPSGPVTVTTLPAGATMRLPGAGYLLA